MDKQKQIEEITNYFLIRNKDTGLYFRGKGVNRWGKYYNQASVYRIKGQVESTLKDLARRGENVEIVPIYISKIPEGAVVLTDEEYERWQGQTLNIKKVRKETAEKFAERLKEMANKEIVRTIFDEFVYYRILEDKIDEICKEFTEESNEENLL